MASRRRTFGWRFFWASGAVVFLSGGLTVAALVLIGAFSPRGTISVGQMDHAVHDLASSVGALWGSPDRWHARFDEFRRARRLDPVQITVIGVEGRVLYQEGGLVRRFAEASAGRLTRDELIGLLAGKGYVTEDDRVYVVAPVLGGAETLGVVVGELAPYSAYAYRPRPLSQIYTLVISGLATVFACSLVSAYLARGLRSRLSRMTDAIRSMAEGDYRSRLPVGSADEVGQVAEAFNRMADRLSEARAQDEALERLKTELVTNVSHELRGPLTSLRGYLEAVEDGLARDPETVRNYLRVVRAKSEQLSHLVEDLLLYSRLEGGNLPMDRKESEVAEWLRRSLAACEPDVSAAGLEIDASIPEVAGTAVLDARRMDQVVGNLVQNAVRYSPRGTTLRVSLCSDPGGGVATISLCDEGPGLDPEDVPHLFERFYRGRRQADGVGVGVGLGLAIAAYIVRAHGGRIWADNLPARGAAFHFTLPLLDHPDPHLHPHPLRRGYL